MPKVDSDPTKDASQPPYAHQASPTTTTVKPVALELQEDEQSKRSYYETHN